MRKLVAAEFITLDGVMQAPGSPDEDRSGGFDQGGWQLSYFDDVFGRVIMDGLAQTGGFLLGRRTYEIFAAHWPNQPDEDPLAGTFNTLPKHVVSTTLSEPLPWVNSTLIRSDVPRAVEALKNETGKDIQIIGSGELVRSLAAEGLIDEYRILIHPLTLGGGKQLFPAGTGPMRLRLTNSETTGTGVLVATYVPAR
jgi:dihydrofolate reductase